MWQAARECFSLTLLFPLKSSLACARSPIISFLVPASVPNVPYHIHFTRGERDARSDIINYKFSSYDVICVCISLCLGAWYLFKKVSIWLRELLSRYISVYLIILYFVYIILVKPPPNTKYSRYLHYYYKEGIFIFLCICL